MIFDITRISAWYSDTVKPCYKVIKRQHPNMIYLFILLIALIVLLIFIRRKKVTKRKNGGYRNFQGDIWYPDGRVWHEKTKTWEEPDYKKQNK